MDVPSADRSYRVVAASESRKVIVMSGSTSGALLSELGVSQDRLMSLIQRYRIRPLVLFGSAARRELTPGSDIDLLVEFEQGCAPSLGGLVTIGDDFSALFGRRVDLATTSILNNPYRRRAIERDMEELYAA